jgi:hypothetical protein
LWQLIRQETRRYPQEVKELLIVPGDILPDPDAFAVS